MSSWLSFRINRKGIVRALNPRPLAHNLALTSSWFCDLEPGDEPQWVTVRICESQILAIVTLIRKICTKIVIHFVFGHGTIGDF